MGERCIAYYGDQFAVQTGQELAIVQSYTHEGPFDNIGSDQNRNIHQQDSSFIAEIFDSTIDKRWLVCVLYYSMIIISQFHQSRESLLKS